MKIVEEDTRRIYPPGVKILGLYVLAALIWFLAFVIIRGESVYLQVVAAPWLVISYFFSRTDFFQKRRVLEKAIFISGALALVTAIVLKLIFGARI